MSTYRLAIIGFGNVGQGFAQILAERGADLARANGLDLQIVAVCDQLKGSLLDPAGLDPSALLAAVQSTGRLDSVPAPTRGLDALQTIAAAGANVLVELSYTDLKTGQPALSHLRAALSRGMHVVTTNKGPIALHYPELKSQADANGLQIGIEGTVMSGTPSLRLGQELLSAAGITRLQGILNGTTNYILTQMESGLDYAAALASAQTEGYAEADPTGDVEGFDASGKAVILAQVLMGASLRMDEVDRTGITALTAQDVQEALAAGERWKLIASLERDGSRVRASVRPLRLPLSHPLAAVGGATNAITFTTDLLGDVTLVGPGAGRLATGYALLCDLLAIHRAAPENR